MRQSEAQELTVEQLTAAQKKALLVMLQSGPVRPRRFAELMWPDSPGWLRYSNVVFDELVSGIKRQSKMILDNVGLVRRMFPYQLDRISWSELHSWSVRSMGIARGKRR